MAVLATRRARLARRSRPVVYHRLLVPLVGDCERAVELACRLAGESASSIDAVAPLEVPLELPFEVPLEEQGQLARSLVAEARAVADRYGAELRGRIVRTRHAGVAVVEEAAQRESDAIVLAAVLAGRSGERSSFGSLADHVL